MRSPNRRNGTRTRAKLLPGVLPTSRGTESDISHRCPLTVPRQSSEIPVAEIWLAPERDLQDHRLPPRLIHPLNHIGRLTIRGQVALDRDYNGRDKRDEIAG